MLPPPTPLTRLADAAQQIEAALDDPVHQADLARIEDILGVGLETFRPRYGVPRREFMDQLYSHIAKSGASEGISPRGPKASFKSQASGAASSLMGLANRRSSRASPGPYAASPRPTASPRGADPATELLTARLRERQRELANCFDDFALQAQIRVDDLPELLSDFGQAIGLELAAASPGDLVQFFLENAAADTVTFPVFAHLFQRYGSQPGALQITPILEAPSTPSVTAAAPGLGGGGSGDPFRDNLVQTLANFENTPATSPAERQRLSELISVLRKQLDQYDRSHGEGGGASSKLKSLKAKKGSHRAAGSTGPGRKAFGAMTRDQQEDFCLFEAFTFYAKSVIISGKAATFEHLEKQTNVVYLGELLRMCEDFGFKLTKAKVTEIFKRVSYNSRELTFEEFKAALPLLEKEAQAAELVELEKKQKELDSKHPKGKDPVNDYYGKYRKELSPTNESHPEDEKRRVADRMAKLKQKDQDYRLAALERMEIPNLEKLRAHLKKFTNAFGMRDKQAEAPSHKPRVKANARDQEAMRRHLQEVRAERDRAKREKEQIAKEKYEQSRRVMSRIHQRLAGPTTYTGIQNKKMGLPPDERHQKLTWKVLEDLSYTDINQDAADDFRPADMMLDENDAQLELELTKLGVHQSYQQPPPQPVAQSYPAAPYGLQQQKSPQRAQIPRGQPKRPAQAIVRHNSVPKGQMPSPSPQQAKARGSVPRQARKQPAEMYVENYGLPVRGPVRMKPGGASHGSLSPASKARKVAEDYMQRGAQLDAQSRMHQEMRMNRAMHVHEQHVKKGLLAAKRKL